MSTKAKQYDGDLAVAALVLNIILTATQIGFVADGLMAVSGQGWFLSLLFAIVIATGLLHSQFVLNRLWIRDIPVRYAWCLAILTGAIISMMSVWGMTRLAEPWTYKWYFGAFLGALVPLETTLLANMTTETFALAGDGWFSGSLTERLLAVVNPYKGKHESAPSGETLGASSEASVAPSSRQATAQDKSALAEVPPAALPAAQAEPVAQTEPAQSAKPTSPAPGIAPLRVKVETVQTEQESTPILTPTLVSNTRQATYSFSGERVTVVIHGEMSKRKWKDLHCQLRRISTIKFDDATSTNQNGGRLRTLSGRVSFPERSGKKNKRKRENARQKHIEEVLEILKSVVERDH